MKKTILTILLLSSNLLALKAQTNLVQNPSFEIYDTCPKSEAEVSYAVGWNSFDQTPDYFNACCPNVNFSVPYNWGGFLPAASGVAYCALGAYVSHIYKIDTDIDEREFIGGHLTANLVIGTKYYVSFKAAPSISAQIESNCAINHLGAMFSTVAYGEYKSAPITNHPQVYTDSIIADTGRWTEVFGSFIADSAYKYIIVGNFFDDLHTDTLLIHGHDTCFAYYYIDNVCVSTDSIYAFNYTYTGIPEINESSVVDIYPNPVNQKLTINLTKLINKIVNLSITDVTGREIKKYTANSYDDYIQLDVSSLAAGMYFINIKNAKINLTQKFIKQ